MEQTIQSYNKIFWDLVKAYDLNESNIFRKMIHSFDVAKNCFELACSEKFNRNQRNLCYLIGLLHDIGRFEQWTKFKTYDDRKSVDHGELSYEMLNNMDCSSLFNISKKEESILKEAIRFHTKPYLGTDKEIIKFNEIINNSDAYSNVVYVANGMHQITTVEDGVTNEILKAFNNRELMNVFSPKTKLDRCLILCACCYYVKSKHFRKNILACNYIDMMFETFSRYLTHEDCGILKVAMNSLKESYLIEN